jgi:hypothetical protein
MKGLILFIVVVLTINISAQEYKEESMFSNLHLSILGGTNFHTIPTLGGSVIFEGKASINSKFDVKLSLSYTSLFENKEYTIKSYIHSKRDNLDIYQLRATNINQLQYTVIPINVGVEYTLLNSNFSPLGIIEVGYNFYSAEEQISSGLISGEEYQNLNDVPNEYRNVEPRDLDGSYLGFGFGLGFKYKISSSFDLSIRYMFRYNDLIVNSNQILLGISI